MPEIAVTFARKKIAIRDSKGEVHIREALICGALAVHAHLEDSPPANFASHVVTHLPTGYRVLQVGSEDLGKKIVETLWRSCSYVFKLSDMEEVRSKTPVWVKAWIRDCWSKGEHLDIKSFKKTYEDAMAAMD